MFHKRLIGYFRNHDKVDTLCFFSLLAVSAQAQTSFLDGQKIIPQLQAQLKQNRIRLKAMCFNGHSVACKEMYIRSFKYDSQMEVWVRNNNNEPFKLFKTYKVCALAGTLGPKRMEGDFQVPEGFYYITEFNPKSDYHLSLKLNYPNQSDKLLSDTYKPGGGIYIHGSCVTVGCIPINDQQIEELYILAASAKNSGQDFIPVHIFPVRYNKPESVEYLTKL